MILLNFVIGLFIGYYVFHYITKDWKIGIPICIALSILATSILHLIKYIANN